MNVISWLSENWPAIVIPLAIFLFALFVLFWFRRRLRLLLQRWFKRNQWKAGEILFTVLRIPSILWNILISAYAGIAASSLPATWKEPTTRGLWSLFTLSITIAAINVVNSLLNYYSITRELPGYALSVLKNTARIIILIVFALSILEIWGIPTSPVLFLVIVIVLIAVLAFRDAVPDLFAGFQLSSSQHFKVEDYIKLETGEEGYVTQIRWNNTNIKSQDGSTITMPNRRLTQRTVVNYGQTIKRAKEPFRFTSRTYVKELTGLRARNLRELVDILKNAPDAVIYYHTHHFIEEHHYLSSTPSNDFAVWVTDSLANEVLGERLASIDIFAFTSLQALKDRIVSIIEEYIATDVDGRNAMPGREIHLVKSVSFILPTPYVANDLREFVEDLRKISLGSLYFHIFESRLRLGRGLNDFSAWLENSLDEAELAKEIARIDPYTFTLEGLRSLLIRLTEKHIK